MHKVRQPHTRHVAPTKISGFTLIELLIVMALIGLITGFAVPSVRSILDHNQLRSAAEGLRVDMLKLRSDATLLNRPLYLHFQTGAAWCYGVSNVAIPACNCAVANSCTVTKTDSTGAAITESIQVTAVNFNNVTMNAVGAGSTAISPVSLSPAGVATNNGIIQLRLSNDAATVVDLGLNPLGRVKICSGQVSGYSPAGTCP